MIMSSAASQGRVLVRLSEVTQELTVGIGSATASVRTLTDISLVVRECELVVLSGSRGAGERAVLAVVAGDRRGFSGVCDVSADARIRIMRIGARSALALAEEWQRSGDHLEMTRDARVQRDAADLSSNPDVFLLDVVPDVDSVGDAFAQSPHVTRVREAHVHNGRAHRAEQYTPKPWNEKNRASLRAWAEVCRMRRGAVIMAAGHQVGAGMFDAALMKVRQTRSVPVGGPAAVREVLLDDSSSVRVVAMHSGRLAATVQLRATDLSA